MNVENPQGRPRVLFVDDEPRILIALKVLFRTEYEVFTAGSGQQALDILRTQAVDVVVSDQRMPRMTGVELLNQVKQQCPRAIRVLLTGYSDINAIVGAINDGEIFRFVNKPWTNAELRATVAAAVRASRVDSVTDEWPLGADTPAPGKAPTEPGGIGILILDDDVETRARVHQILDAERSVYTAGSLDEGLSVLEQQRIGVIITELVVGGETVTDLLGALRQHHPSLVAIVLAAQADADHSIELINRGQIYRFLNKPVSEGLLRGSVNLATRRFEILQKNPQQTQRIAAETTPAGNDRLGLFQRIGRMFGLTA